MGKKIRTAVLVVPFHFRAIAPSERTEGKRREREKGGGNGRNERRSRLFRTLRMCRIKNPSDVMAHGGCVRARPGISFPVY